MFTNPSPRNLLKHLFLGERTPQNELSKQKAVTRGQLTSATGNKGI